MGTLVNLRKIRDNNDRVSFCIFVVWLWFNWWPWTHQPMSDAHQTLPTSNM